MARTFLVLYGSYRSNRMGIRLADYLIRRLSERGDSAELIDAKAVGLPMLDKRYMDYGPGEAPAEMIRLAEKLRAADGFVFVEGEYNWGVQPGLKNLLDHYFAEWQWRPAAVASYSAGRLGGVRGATALIPTLTELGMVALPSMLSVGQIGQALDAEGQPTGDGGAALDHGFARFADELAWWADAAAEQRARMAPPY